MKNLLPVRYLLKIYTFLFSVLFALIPFTEHIQAIPNILMGLLILIFPFAVKKSDWKGIKKNVGVYSYLGLIFIVLIGMLRVARWEDFNFLTKILIIPVLFILSLPVKDYKRPLYFFLLGSGSLLLISSVNLLQHYCLHNELKLDVGSHVNQLLMGERPYLGFIYLISFCISIFLIKREKNNPLMKKLLYVSAFIFSVFIILISARLSILSLVIILACSFFFTKNKQRTFFISAGTILLMGLFTILNPNFISRFTAGFEQKEFNIDKIISMEPRSHIWECSVSIGKKNIPILGYGFRNTIEKLTNCYAERKGFLNEPHKAYFVASKFNTHNQFLNFYLSSGIFSLIAFMSFFFYLFKSNYSTYTTFALVLALFLFCCFENVLSRQLGAMLFGVIISFLFLICHNSVQTENK